MSAGIKDLLGNYLVRDSRFPRRFTSFLVLKSTGSAFEKFIRDEYTTLVEVDDRIFSTSVDLTYTFEPIKISTPTDIKKLDFVIPVQKGEEGHSGSVWDEDVPNRARNVTLETFALDDSASVQVSDSRHHLVFILR